MKTFRSTLIALAVFFSLMVVFYFLKLSKDQKEAKSDAQLQMLHFAPDEVVSIAILTPNQKISFGRTQAISPKGNELYRQWEITEPSHVPVDDNEMKYLLQTLPSLKAKRFVSASETDLSPFGFKEIKFRINIEAKSTTKEVQIGKRSTIVDEYYAKISDENAIYMIEGQVAERLGRRLDSFREHEIMDFDPVKALYFEVTSTEQKWSAKKVDNPGGTTKWMVSFDQKEQEANQEEILGLLRGMKDLRVDSFLADHITSKEVEEHGLSKPALRFLIREESGKQDGLWTNQVRQDDPKKQVAVMKPEGRFIYGLNGAFLAKLSSDPRNFLKTSQTEGKTDGK